MSVYVGIDVHRKRSQVAVVDESGEMLANRNVPNGTETILSVIGGLAAGDAGRVRGGVRHGGGGGAAGGLRLRPAPGALAAGPGGRLRPGGERQRRRRGLCPGCAGGPGGG